MAAKIFILAFATFLSQVASQPCNQPILFTESASFIPVEPSDVRIQTILAPAQSSTCYTQTVNPGTSCYNTPCQTSQSVPNQNRYQTICEPEVTVEYIPLNSGSSCNKRPSVPARTFTIPFGDNCYTPTVNPGPSCYNTPCQTSQLVPNQNCYQTISEPGVVDYINLNSVPSCRRRPTVPVNTINIPLIETCSSDKAVPVSIGNVCCANDVQSKPVTVSNRPCAKPQGTLVTTEQIIESCKLPNPVPSVITTNFFGDYNNILQTSPETSVASSEASSVATSNSRSNGAVTQTTASSQATATSNTRPGNSGFNNYAVSSTETTSTINNNPARNIGPASLYVQPTGCFSIETSFPSCSCCSPLQPACQNNPASGSVTSIASSDAFSSINTGKSNNYGNIGQPNYVNSYASSDALAYTNLRSNPYSFTNIVQPLSSPTVAAAEASSSTGSYGGFNTIASADASAFSALNTQSFASPTLLNIPQPVPIVPSRCEVPIKLNNAQLLPCSTSSVGVSGFFSNGPILGVDSFSPSSVSFFEYCKPAYGLPSCSSTNYVSENMNELNALIDCLNPLVEIVDRLVPLCASSGLGQSSVQVSPIYSGISETSSSAAASSAASSTDGSSAASSAASSATTSSVSNFVVEQPCDSFPEVASTTTTTVASSSAASSSSGSGISSNGAASSSSAASTSVTVTEERNPISSFVSPSILYNPYNIIQLPSSPITFEVEIPNSISTCIPSVNYFSSGCSYPVEYVVELPSSIPAQLACTLGSVPVSQPVLGMNLQPLQPSCCGSIVSF